MLDVLGAERMLSDTINPRIRLTSVYSETYEVGFQAFARVSGFGIDAGTHPPPIKLTMHT